MEARTDGSRLWLTASLGTVLAVSLGAGLGWWLRGGSTQAAALSPAPSTGATREEIEELKRELLARLDELTRVPATNTPAAAGTDDQVIELGRRIDALESRVALAGGPQRREETGALWTPPRGPGGGSIDSIIERMQAWFGSEISQRQGVDVETQLKQEHELWTFEDIVRAYGPPRRWEHVHRDWNLYYGSFAIAGWDMKQSVCFEIRDGYVSQVEIMECEP